MSSLSNPQLDGAIARKFPSQQSVFGTVLDPFADKALVLTVAGCMGASGALPIPLTAVLFGKDIGLLLGSFFVRYRSLKVGRVSSSAHCVLAPEEAKGK